MTYEDSLTAPETLARLERLVALARRTPPDRSRLLRQRGRGLEPAGRRDYTPGDDVRRLDWAAWARLGRLLTWVPEEQQEPRLELLVDASGSVTGGAPPVGVRARLVAASLAAAAVARGARVTVWWASTPPRRRQLNRPGELVGLLQFLAPLRPAGAGDLEGAARLAADTASGQGRGNAVLITDGLEPTCLRTALLLRQRGFAPLVVAVRPAVELTASVRAAALASGVVEAVDAETGATRRLPVSARGLTEALARREARCGALLRSLADHGIAATTLAPELPFDTIARDSIRGRRERARP